MHTSFFAILAASLPLLSTAATIGAETHFYGDGVCAAFLSNAEAFYTQAPYIGTNGEGAGCITLNPPGNALSANTAAIFEANGSTETDGFCIFYDGYTCEGNQEVSNFTPGNGHCLPARSSAGYLWKSAKCYVN
ncbi:hypothetical protein HMN09_00011200 [Mycena chlorophos]|uniref:Uncharacterized protein n=1 Tax=Mycena chlorophos TaxID=658473 RepID=A0A8H6TRC0_MYCCL|nr:hypothetical protein HMN09_00011200 [Mycena chlorophos]